MNENKYINSSNRKQNTSKFTELGQVPIQIGSLRTQYIYFKLKTWT